MGNPKFLSGSSTTLPSTKDTDSLYFCTEGKLYKGDTLIAEKNNTAVATTSANGLMSSSDKSKLDGIASGANKYTLPTASTTVLGGVCIGSNITLSSNHQISIEKSDVTNALGYTPLQSHQSISGKANLSGATFTGNVTLNAGKALQLNTIKAPTASSGSTYGPGTNGQVLKSNGSTVYWASDYNTMNTAGSTNTSSKIFLIGATSQSANPVTYSHDTAYVGSDGCLYSNGTKVLTSHQSIAGKSDTSHTHKVKINGVEKTIAASSGTAVDLGTYRADTKPASGNWFNGTPLVGSDGVSELGKYLDLHHANTSTLDYSVRLICPEVTKGVSINLPRSSGTLALTSDVAGVPMIVGSTTGWSSSDGMLTFEIIAKQGISNMNSIPAGTVFMIHNTIANCSGVNYLEDDESGWDFYFINPITISQNGGVIAYSYSGGDGDLFVFSAT